MKKATEPRVQFHAHLPRDLHRQMEEAADKDDRTLTAWVKRAIVEKLERDAQQA